MNKTVILPLIALVCMAIKLAFGIEIKPDLQSQIVDGVSNVVFLAFTVYGIFKNHKVDKK